MRELRAPTFKLDLHEAIREGRKTQTRRICKYANLSIHRQSGGTLAVSWCDRPGEPHTATVEQFLARAPYGPPSTVWALRERLWRDGDGLTRYADGARVYDRRKRYRQAGYALPWKKQNWKRNTQTSLFMPTFCARDFVTVSEVRVQRVQDIDYQGCMAEGARIERDIGCFDGGGWEARYKAYRNAFTRLWDSIHGPGAWDRNDWVFVYTFGQYQRDAGRKMP